LQYSQISTFLFPYQLNRNHYTRTTLDVNTHVAGKQQAKLLIPLRF